MGLLSKKSVICESCGKEYEVRIALGTHICEDCKQRIWRKEHLVGGYISYAQSVGMPKYTEEQLDQIAMHRERILQESVVPGSLSRQDLQCYSDNYKSLTEDQLASIAFGIIKSTLRLAEGAAYASLCYVLTSFEKVVIHVEDIFAVGIVSLGSDSSVTVENLLCVYFTNDPYVPVFSIATSGKLGMFEMSKSKKGRENLAEMIQTRCPNLTYPVCDIQKLKKQIKAEDTVRGNIDKKFMLKQISDATAQNGIFQVKEFKKYISSDTAKLLSQYNMFLEDEIHSILRMDERSRRKFWEKHMFKF